MFGRESVPESSDFVERLRDVGLHAYHDKHPFHRAMNAGRLGPEEICLWVANRYYYQKSIPIKDAVLLSRCPDREVRRRWVQRILDHDGYGDDPGGIENWLRLGEAVGLSRETLESDRLLLPAVRFAVDAYVHFVREHEWIEGVASSLTELFAPPLLAERLAALEERYPWIDRRGFDYFRARLGQAPRDAEYALQLVLEHCRTAEAESRAVDALQFKCDLLWAQLDAIQQHCDVAHLVARRAEAAQG